MRIDNSNIGKEAWITFVDGDRFDGPHRRCSTNKANLTKYITKGKEPNLENTFIQKFIISYTKNNSGTDKFCYNSDTYEWNAGHYLKPTNEIYNLTIKDKKKYTLVKIGAMI